MTDVHRRSAALACGLFAMGAAHAHDLGTSPVHPVLDALPPALHGVTVEVAETLAPQVLVANPGPEILTVLDAAGRGFLRIGPAGVEADLNAEAWYKSLSTASVPEPAAAYDPHSAPRWEKINAASSLGWFDGRLAVTAHAPSAAMRKADVAASTGTWSIPVLVGAKPATIAGHFEYVPPADGAYVTRLEPPAGFPSGVRLMVSQGATPAVLLTDPGLHDIVLIGSAGEDEVRIGRGGTFVNTGSPTWRHWAVTQRAALETGPARWIKVSAGAAYSWLEPRGQAEAEGEGHPQRNWLLPLRIDRQAYTVRGVATWRDTEVAAR